MKNFRILFIKNLRRMIGLVVLHLLFCFVFAHHRTLEVFRCCAVEASVDLREVLGGDALIVGFDPDFPPMGKLSDSGEAGGADVELARAVAKKLGVKIIFQPINWDAKEAEVNSGRVHAIWNGFSKTNEREEAFLLSGPYMENNQQIVVKKNSGIESLADLKGKQVCLQKGSSAESSFEKSKVASLVKGLIKLESCVDCLNELLQNKSDAAVVDEVVLSYYLSNSKMNKADFEVLPESLSKEVFVIGMKKNNVELCRALEKAYNELATEDFSVLQEISQKWFGKQMFLRKMESSLKNLQNSSNVKQRNGDLFLGLISGLFVTLKLFVFCLVFSLPLGLIFCLLKNLKIKLLNFLISSYVVIMRGTPLLLQLFFAFYGLPMVIPGLVLKNRFLVGLLVFVFNYAAYFAEIFRGGLLSISRGQFESAEILQIPKLKAVFKIFLPQMLKCCLPSICNEAIALVKDTALIFALGVIELLTMAKNLVNSTADVSIYLIVAVIYLLICSALNFGFSLLEKKFKF